MIIIRSMTEDDIPALTAIISDNYDKHCAEAFQHESRCAFSDYPFKPRFLVAADRAGLIFGCACWTADWCSWGVFNISWVQVHRTWQRQGVGTSLVTAALGELRPIASTVLLMTTKPQFYEKKWRFKPLMRCRSSMIYEEGGEFETLMGLEL